LIDCVKFIPAAIIAPTPMHVIELYPCWSEYHDCIYFKNVCKEILFH